MSQKFDKLKGLLKELFQLDQPDLDFGLYRIMHAKADEVTQFLEKDLLPQVKEAFGAYRTADKAELDKELHELVAGIEKAGMDPAQSPKVQELQKRISEDAVDIAGLENEVYDHLFSFFRRYYHEGDYLAKRVYKPGVYAIPYEGEEVKLHWANRDQYYIKSSEYLRDYAFTLKPDAAPGNNPMRVHFRLVDAAEGEHGNVKATNGDRVFILALEDFIAEEGGELVIRFAYRPATMNDWTEDAQASVTAAASKKPPGQKDLSAMAVGRVLAVEDEALRPWITELSKPHVKTNGEQADYSRLAGHLNRYTARNTFDYFIHKDLGGFLRRELDFYIKNEVMHLDDVESETAPRVEQYLSKIKVVRKIAGKLIDFLAQLEDFQKKLWLKKKFVVETNYCITLDRIPKQFYPDIARSDAQRQEWVRLFGIDSLTGGRLGEVAYSEPLTVDFLEANAGLPVDTCFFSSEWTCAVIDAIDDLDGTLSGTLVHSENSQASDLLKKKYRQQSKLVYLDPPYNTDATPILYKNNYKESSWASMMADRINHADDFVSYDGAVAYAIDDTEVSLLKELIKQTSSSREVFQCIVEHYPGSGTGRSNVSRTHEYCLFSISKNADVLRGDAVDDGERVRGFRRAGTGDNNFRVGNPGRPESFFAILVDQASYKVVGADKPPIIGEPYPTDDTAEGYKRVYPIGEDGSERVWSLSYVGTIDAISDGRIISSENFVIKRIFNDKERRLLLPSIWQGKQYNATTGGTNLLTEIFGDAGRFDYPKSIGTMSRVIDSVLFGDRGALVIDLFGGSGTTAHALIEKNANDGTKHKYILMEMGGHADSVIKERISKVVYSPEWRSGLPVVRGKGLSHILKYIRLESYEDALNNLVPSRDATQQSLLDAVGATGDDGLKEQYMLRYMLDVETRGSQSLLNIEAFKDPTAYRLKVKRPGGDESLETNVDLLETFNYLVGLTVQHIAAPQTFAAEFERDGEGRLRLKGRMKPNEAGPWWFRAVTGTTPDGKRTLVIWRMLTGDAEQDNLVLDEWFTKQGYSTKDYEFHLIYVNGDNNLENLRQPDDTWKVRLIEEDFHRLMFDIESV